MTGSVRPRLAAAVLAGLALVAVASPAGASPAVASSPGVVQTPVLTSAAVLTMADAAMKEAAKRGQRVTVVVVDRSGATRLVLKGEGAGPQTEESARRKAFTAVSFGRTTAELGKTLTGAGPTIADIPGTLFLGGGVPVASGGAPVAGVGVGGAPSGDVDEAIARAAVRAVAGQVR
jgi:uncharacterized protein GlcG (DUF336 family)